MDVNEELKFWGKFTTKIRGEGGGLGWGSGWWGGGGRHGGCERIVGDRG